MSSFCGLDFGTSNTTIGVIKDGLPILTPLTNHKPAIRSAIFCDAEVKEWVFGQEGINRYLESTPGRLLMALKSVLGSSLMEDKTMIFDEYIPYTSVLSHFIRFIKARAEHFSGSELTQVVMGRPVHFHDTDQAKDRLAQETLEKIAKEVGFKEVVFQYEPIAAALAYEMTIQKEQLALIVDMGGGTSDFTVIRLHPRSQIVDRASDVLANSGIHIAGTDFDQRLSLNLVMPLLGMHSLIRGSSSDIEVPSAYYHELTTWHTLATLYNATTISHVRAIQTAAYEKHLLDRLIRVLRQRAGHHILDAIETGKQQLSEQLAYTVDLQFIEDNLFAPIARENFNSMIMNDCQRIIDTLLQTVKMAAVPLDAISAIFYTGGTSKIPIIREQMNAFFKNAEIVQGDAFGSVGTGLTIDAQRRFR